MRICCHPPCGGCGLKSKQSIRRGNHQGSPSMRRVWIEMLAPKVLTYIPNVTLHAEGVDWNYNIGYCWPIKPCHPPCGGCGLKFIIPGCVSLRDIVTLHAEGVDWNCWRNRRSINHSRSPSMRRVWIEIWRCWWGWYGSCRVTLHAEGVDWNMAQVTTETSHSLSPSMRRVWIEMLGSRSCP